MVENHSPRPVDRQEQVRVQRYGDLEHQTQVIEDLDAERRMEVSRVAQLIWLLFGVLEALIGLRVVLKLVAANPANPFANLVYSLTAPFLWPFQGLTVTPSAQGIVLEISSIIAIFVYALIGWILVRLFWLIFYQPSARSVRTIEHEHEHDHITE
jgi:uncharacterized protein YggT (Ycf19 family)